MYKVILRKSARTVELGDKELFGHPRIVPYPYEVNWQIGHGKWFLNTNMFLIKLFLITNFDCIRTQVLFKGGSYMRKYGMHH